MRPLIYVVIALLFLFALFIILDKIHRYVYRMLVRRRLVRDERIIEWSKVRSSGDSGFLLVNDSRSQWPGLRYWWVPDDGEEGTEDILQLWLISGLLITGCTHDCLIDCFEEDQIIRFKDWYQ